MSDLTEMERDADREAEAARLASGWMPIETAPKDGEMILVLLPRIMNLIVRASYCGVHGYWKTDHEANGGITNPTFFHEGDMWHPMPPLPGEIA